MSDRDHPTDTGVIDLAARSVTRSSPQLARIESYWRDVRGTRLAPSRAEIDPRGLSGVLSNAFVLERIAPGLARFRISGSHLTDLMGLDVRGMPLSTIFTPDARQTLSDALVGAFDDPSIIRFRLAAETGFGRPELVGHMVLLPLRSDLGEVSRILGGIDMQGTLGRAPRRLLIEEQSREGLTGVGATAPVNVQSFDERLPAPKPREDTTRPSHPHLTLVIDNAE